MSDKLFANIATSAPEKDKAADKPAATATTKDKVAAPKETPAPKPEATKAPEPVKQPEPVPVAPEPAPVKPAPAPVVEAPEPVEDEIPDTDFDNKLTIMRGRADIMGIAYKPEHSADYIEALIDMKLASDQTAPSAAAPVVQASAPLTGGDRPTKSLRQHVIDENMKLVRIRLTNMDQKDQSLNGDIFTVSNEYLGDVKRFVPYQDKFYTNGYHVEACILKQLQDKKYLRISVTQNSQKQEVIESSWVKKFAIEILPPLTEAEIERLRITQLQSGSTSAD